MYNVWYWVFGIVFVLSIVCYVAFSLGHLRLLRQQVKEKPPSKGHNKMKAKDKK